MTAVLVHLTEPCSYLSPNAKMPRLDCDLISSYFPSHGQRICRIEVLKRKTGIMHLVGIHSTFSSPFVKLASWWEGEAYPVCRIERFKGKKGTQDLAVHPSS